MMMRAGVAAMAAVMMAAPAFADALVDQIVAGARTAAPVAFERTLTLENSDGQRTMKRVQVDRFDSRAPAGRQWSLLSVDGAAPSDADRQAHQKAAAGSPVPGYQRVATFLSRGATRGQDAQGRTVLRVASLPAGSVKANGFDLSSRLSAELTVTQAGGRAMVSRARIFLAQPTRIMMVAKLNRFEAVSEYDLSGAMPMLVAQTSETAGSNPMQGSGTMRQRVTFRALS